MTIETRVTNSFLNNQIKSFMTENRAKIQEIANEVASGKIIEKYSDLVGRTSIEGLLSNKEIKQSLESKLINNTNLKSKLTEIDRVKSGLRDVVKESLKICQRALDPSISAAVNLNSLAKDQLQQIQLLLNSSFNGQKLFAGGKTDVAITVDDISTNSNIVNGIITANYYNGDSYILNYDIARDRNLSYGVTADNPVFQNFIAAHHYLLDGYPSTAFTMLQQFQSDIGNLIINTGNNLATVENQIEVDHRTISVLFEEISNVEDTDILQAMTDMLALQVQLQASFMLANKIADLSLVNYMR